MDDYTILFGIAAVIIIFCVISLIARRLKKADSGQNEVTSVSSPAVPAATLIDTTVEVAVISAAIAAYLGKSSHEYVVRSIRRVPNGETVWAQAGRINAVK